MEEYGITLIIASVLVLVYYIGSAINSKQS
jgi:hypothetical protein